MLSQRYSYKKEKRKKKCFGRLGYRELIYSCLDPTLPHTAPTKATHTLLSLTNLSFCGRIGATSVGREELCGRNEMIGITGGK